MTIKEFEEAVSRKEAISAYIYRNISELTSEEFFAWLERNWDYTEEMRYDEVLRCYYDGEELAVEEEEALG